MPVIRVAAGVICRGDLVLACRRRPDKLHPLQWEFPGGKLEADETFEACLVRELREELAVEATIRREISRTTHSYPNGVDVEVAFFLVDVDGTPQNIDFSEIRWVPRGRLGELDFVEADRGVVDRLDCGDR